MPPADNSSEMILLKEAKESALSQWQKTLKKKKSVGEVMDVFSFEVLQQLPMTSKFWDKWIWNSHFSRLQDSFPGRGSISLELVLKKDFRI